MPAITITHCLQCKDSGRIVEWVDIDLTQSASQVVLRRIIPCPACRTIGHVADQPNPEHHLEQNQASVLGFEGR